MTMKSLTYILAVLMLVNLSCSGTNKLFRSKKTNTESGLGKTLMPATPIREIEEKLVTENNEAPDPHSYFVIIGSFRDINNARDHQAIIKKDGFESSGLLRNEAGLYRVSVMATDDVTEARREVTRIWAEYPAYSDTWLLIQLK